MVGNSKQVLRNSTTYMTFLKEWYLTVQLWEYKFNRLGKKYYVRFFSQRQRVKRSFLLFCNIPKWKLQFFAASSHDLDTRCKNVGKIYVRPLNGLALRLLVASSSCSISSFIECDHFSRLSYLGIYYWILNFLQQPCRLIAC